MLKSLKKDLDFNFSKIRELKCVALFEEDRSLEEEDSMIILLRNFKKAIVRNLLIVSDGSEF